RPVSIERPRQDPGVEGGDRLGGSADERGIPSRRDRPRLLARKRARETVVVRRDLQKHGAGVARELRPALNVVRRPVLRWLSGLGTGAKQREHKDGCERAARDRRAHSSASSSESSSSSVSTASGSSVTSASSSTSSAAGGSSSTSSASSPISSPPSRKNVPRTYARSFVSAERW